VDLKGFLFNHLNENDILKIIDIEIKNLMSRLKELKLNIKIPKKVKKFILDKGFDEKFGARPLKRVIQKYIEDIIAEEIINKRITDNDVINLDVKEDKIIIN